MRPASPEEVTVITVPDPADNKRVSSNSISLSFYVYILQVRPASPEEVTVITVPDPADNKRVSSNSSGSRNSNGILVMGQAAGSSGGNR